jgi:hypothetical protein
MWVWMRQETCGKAGASKESDSQEEIADYWKW